jgi:hypothetical protein
VVSVVVELNAKRAIGEKSSKRDESPSLRRVSDRQEIVTAMVGVVKLNPPEI